MTTPTRERVPIREGLFAGDLSDLPSVRLQGSRCGACGETSLGHHDLCPNCSSNAMADLPLSAEGTLWTFTVSRHRPPGNYRGAEPFTPFGLGLVELAEGIRVMTPLDGDIDSLRIGMPAHFAPYVRHDDEQDVVAFLFRTALEENSDA